MGTIISLNVGPIELSWSKNSPGIHHGDLFLPTDRKVDPPDLDYNPPEPGVPVFETNLSAVRSRLELLGYTFRRAKLEYEVACRLITQQEQDYATDSGETYVRRDLLTFDELRTLIDKVTVDKISGEYDPKVSLPKLVVPLETLKRLPWYEHEYHNSEFNEGSIITESVSAEYLLGGFDPYTALRLLAENPKNLNSKVRWDFGYLCRQGWAHEDEFHAGVGDRQTFLIVTEGSSDAAMIRHGINLLRPECADFFRYVDMEEGYPFSGTGELHRFIQGFIAMRVPLKVVAVYDNDAVGYEGFLKTVKLKLRSTYRVIRLPDLAAHQTFPVLGAAGEVPCDINRRAGALEAYLDLTRAGLPTAAIDWGAVIPSIGLQQGVLRGKTQFMKDFLRYKGKPDRRGVYDLTRVAAVIDAILDACVSIVEQEGNSGVSARKR